MEGRLYLVAAHVGKCKYGTPWTDPCLVHLCMTAHVESREDRFLIATGTCALEGRRDYVQLWHAVEVEDVDSDTHGIIREGGVARTFSGLRWLEIATIILVSVGAYVLGSLVGLPYRGA
ncbi:hypothetical protein F5141DRAFT_1060892 [Pisolithus sp. B1]|nr:hypothetical protein F5141DRAFT_1060892 [Pisolithus sp. B1]